WTLFLRDEGADVLKFALTVGQVARSLAGKTLPIGEGIAGWVAKSGEPVVVPDVRTDPRFSGRFGDETGFQTRSELFVPLHGQGEVVGAIELVRRPDEPAFSKDDLRLLCIVADFASIAILNARQYERMTQMARLDYLSPLFNSRYLHEALHQRLEE